MPKTRVAYAVQTLAAWLLNLRTPTEARYLTTNFPICRRVGVLSRKLMLSDTRGWGEREAFSTHTSSSKSASPAMQRRKMWFEILRKEFEIVHACQPTFPGLSDIRSSSFLTVKNPHTTILISGGGSSVLLCLALLSHCCTPLLPLLSPRSRCASLCCFARDLDLSFSPIFSSPPPSSDLYRSARCSAKRVTNERLSVVSLYDGLFLSRLYNSPSRAPSIDCTSRRDPIHETALYSLSPHTHTHTVHTSSKPRRSSTNLRLRLRQPHCRRIETVLTVL